MFLTFLYLGCGPPKWQAWGLIPGWSLETISVDKILLNISLLPQSALQMGIDSSLPFSVTVCVQILLRPFKLQKLEMITQYLEKTTQTFLFYFYFVASIRPLSDDNCDQCDLHKQNAKHYQESYCGAEQQINTG